jgi:hypothetical protein
MAGHIVLLGDSIFDNGAYTGGELDVLVISTRFCRVRGKPLCVQSMGL